MFIKRTGKLLAHTWLVSAFILGGCGDKASLEPPAPKVTVAKPLIQEITDYLDFTGNLVASEKTEVRARVSGVLESMHFEPGTEVQQGDLLFVIDPKEYEADLQAAEAELEGAQAQFERASIEYVRAQRLFKQKAGAEADVVKWRVEKAIASAMILRAEAKVERASLNLSYTQVTAPIDGRVGRNLVDIGNLVGESEATVLTVVTHLNPIYAYFNLNELDLLRITEMYRVRVKEEGLDMDKEPDSKLKIPVHLGLANEAAYPHAGFYDFAESGVDPETGTIQLRGVFENAVRPPHLLPGLFVRIRFPLGKRADMPLVTERAIANDQGGTYLLVVKEEVSDKQQSGKTQTDIELAKQPKRYKVVRRSVRTGQLIDGLLVIEEGLKKDEWVIVNGMQRARPGRRVEPEEVEMASLSTSARKKAREAEEKAAEARAQSAEPAAQPSGQKD